MADTTFIINPDRIAQELWAYRDVVISGGLFGGINSSRSQNESHGFAETFDIINLRHIGWPGGTLAEQGVLRLNGNIQLPNNPDLPFAYDLSYPELIHPSALVDSEGSPSEFLGFSDMLRLAIEFDASMSVISPTVRYDDNPLEGGEVLKTFLQDLFIEGRWNDGIFPNHLVIDLGNENYEPISYSKHIVAQLRAVREFRNQHPEVDFEVGIQTAQGPETNLELLRLVEERSPGEHILAEADIVRTHDLMHGLSYQRDFEHSDKVGMVRELMLAIEDDRAALGITDAPEVEVYISAWSSSARDVDPDLNNDLPSAGAALTFLTSAAEIGTDIAAAWGFGMTSPDANEAVIAWHDPETGVAALTPKGELLRQMAEILPGMKLVEHAGMDAGRSWPANIQVFADSSKVVLFIAANDLPTDLHIVEVQLPGIGDLSNVWAESISVETGLSGDPLLRNPAVAVGEEKLAVTLTHDYEIVRIVANRVDTGVDPVWMMADREGDNLEGGVGNDHLIGATGDDTARGNSGDDLLFGRGGDDRLTGDSGNDLLSGGEGNDSLYGGEGADSLYGGNGADSLYGGFGNDRLQSGEGSGNLLAGGGGRDFLIVDPSGDTMIIDFDPADGDLLGFGALYENEEDLRAAITSVDHTGSGEPRDMLISHAGLGITLILGGMLQQDAIMSAMLDLGEVAAANPDIENRIITPRDPPQLAASAAAPTDSDLGWFAGSEADPPPDTEAEEEGEEDTGGGDCFVATAAYGDRLHPDVVLLRHWRDAYLMHYRAGLWFIRLYRVVGSRLARHVRPENSSGKIAKALLHPVVALLRRVYRSKHATIAFLCFPAMGFSGPSVVNKSAPSLHQTEESRIETVANREASFEGYLTGYSYWDNTPPASTAIARPIIHREASGTGTFHDPITIAVGYRLVGGSARLDFPAGTKFYIPRISRYVIVEDICGDGPQPHLTGCHRGRSGRPWLDIYVDGRRAGAAAANACMYAITGMHRFVMNPRNGYPVTTGSLTESGCRG
jgi:hypothetical protein